MSYSIFVKLCLVTVCLSFLLKAKASPQFPADMSLCRPGDTDCVARTSTNFIHQYARKGYPPAGFSIVDPIHLKNIDLSDNHGGTLNLKLNLYDADVTGLSGVNFDKAVGFGADLTTSKFELHGKIPALNIKSKYRADGRILILPIRGDGDASIVLENCKFSIKYKPNSYTQNGKTYLRIDKMKVLVEPQKMIVKLTNLFNGDKMLGDHMNQFLNENWSDVWSELQQSIHRAIAGIVQNVMEPMLKKYAYEDLYEKN